MRYLDPKNDLTFKKVFGEHPHLLKSFLNALLPLAEGQEIVSLEYLPPELVPTLPLLKYSIVDVRCYDNRGRHFIVEMQMIWTDSFKSRVLFNASKAYVKQLDKGQKYKVLQPVYALSLVNEDFEEDTDNHYHHYSIIHNQLTGKKIDGLEFVMVELPKFKAKNFTDKKLQVLWLRFLTEIEDNSETPPADLMQNPELREAIEYLEESAFSAAQLEAYNKYWDTISSEKTLVADAREKGEESGMKAGLKKGQKIGLEKGQKIGLEKGQKIGLEKGIHLTLQVIRLKNEGKDLPTIEKETGQAQEVILKILEEAGLK